MRALLDSPWRATALGLGVCGVMLAAGMVLIGVERAAFADIVLRGSHVLAAFVWAGFIVFVNFVQLLALAEAADAERPIVVRLIVARTARVFAAAAHATLLTGVLLLVLVWPDLAYRPLLMAGMIGGVAMWVIVQFILLPNVARITGRVSANDQEKAAARGAIALWARINLVLVLPVTLAMLLAGHGIG